MNAFLVKGILFTKKLIKLVHNGDELLIKYTSFNGTDYIMYILANINWQDKIFLKVKIIKS